jgi:hypothetical protein
MSIALLDRYAEAVERITNELAQGDLFAGHNDQDHATDGARDENQPKKSK